MAPETVKGLLLQGFLVCLWWYALLMKNEIVERIASQSGIAELVEILAEKLSGSDLHSLLLTVLKRRIAKASAAELLGDSPVSRLCDLDGRLLNAVEKEALEAASCFAARELSPVVPLGAVSLLTGLDQGNVLSTIRAFEVLSDPTVALALECARLRRKPQLRKESLKLCSNSRVLRFPQPANPSFTSHFKLFSLVTAGRDKGSFAFECEALFEHIDSYLAFLERLEGLGFQFGQVAVEVSDTRVVTHLCSRFALSLDDVRSQVRAGDAASAAGLLAAHQESWPKDINTLKDFELPAHLLVQLKLLEEAVCSKLSRKYPQVQFGFNLQRLTGLGYYQGPCFHIKACAAGESYAIADGGFTDWTQVLLSDTKERLLTSAIGTELVCRKFYKELRD